jgi:hypothetical protein
MVAARILAEHRQTSPSTIPMMRILFVSSGAPFFCLPDDEDVFLTLKQGDYGKESESEQQAEKHNLCNLVSERLKCTVG